MDLRSDNKPEEKPATKLVLFNLEAGILSGYDGKVLSQKAYIDIDPDVSKEDLMESIEDFRVASRAGTIEADEVRRKIEENYWKVYGYAYHEHNSWMEALKGKP